MNSPPITYRAWDKERKEMYYQENIKVSYPPDIDCGLTSLNCFFDGLNDREYKNGHRITNGIKEKKWILMQCIGLRDKNLIDVYRSDIVHVEKLPYDKKGIGVVVWDNKMLGYFYKSIEDIWTSNSKYYYKLNGKTLEVIGNIYENPAYGIL